ncbi:unnamed protein product [Bursaphelenchus okinawaensis]|uniref:Acyltransferase 3 domain-containing protein n=1 Tax=Bursaphelenchus okinawaensis TaxID=465554 RepID=A0A811LTL4_9BILA|nr:unnamed protein product [Bursaphelenchus okinawaensis]CAG9127887.1 unnamed protein product [Bursaphelenchus okinawaensis]
MHKIYDELTAAIVLRTVPNNLTELFNDVKPSIKKYTPSFGYNFQMTLVFGWVSFVLLSTFWKPMKFRAVNLKQAFNGLMSSRGSRLDFLDVFRVVAIVWVMANHLGSEGRVDILERKSSAEEFKSSVHNHPILGALLGNSALGVEIFLVLSGLLAARSWHRQSETPFLHHSFVFLIKRILRLLPVIAVFVGLAAGPVMSRLMPRFHDTMISECGVKGIMSHLTLTSNWQETPTCLGYLWYVGLDMQLYLMAPVLLQLLYRAPKLALSTILVLIIGSAAQRANICTSFGVCNKSDVDIPFISFPGQDPATVRQVYAGLWEMYGRPCTKAGPFLIGLVLGFGTTKLELQLRNGVANRIAATGISAAIMVIYAILPEYWYPDAGTTLYNTLYTALFRTVFGAAVSCTIFALFYSEKPTKVAKFWTVLAKLTFNVYLWHMPMVYLFNFVPFFQTATSAMVLVALLPVLACLSFLAAFLFYLFVEDPIARISGQVLQKL